VSDVKKPNPNETVKYDVLGAAVGDNSGPTRERLFVGPKALEVLESVHSNTAPGQMNGPDLRDVVDFGFFHLIARPLFIWLKWTQEHIARNWGISIIILTVIINLALLPLRIASMKSALKMQKLQPQMKAIQEKYKKYPMRDPRRQEMNTEIGALYKQEGVNPAGGCLPLLIQMPFLFAFYSMLGNAIELRQAPFLWLRDLSSPDKFFVMPVLIVVSTYLVQKMTPNSGMDPKQQQMMTLMMPLMIGWFSFNLPSGLSVYWVLGNVIGIIQQNFAGAHLDQQRRQASQISVEGRGKGVASVLPAEVPVGKLAQAFAGEQRVQGRPAHDGLAGHRQVHPGRNAYGGTGQRFTAIAQRGQQRQGQPTPGRISAHRNGARIGP